MKMEIRSIEYIIDQIKKTNPPVTKDMHKLINNLLILLEKNVVKKESPEEFLLTEKYETLNEFFLELCFLRREIVVKFAEEYADNIKKAIEILEENSKAVNYKENDEKKTIKWNLKTECENTYELVSYIFSKLSKAKMVIEESLENKCKNNKSSIEADAYFEAYLNRS